MNPGQSYSRPAGLNVVKEVQVSRSPYPSYAHVVAQDPRGRLFNQPSSSQINFTQSVTLPPMTTPQPPPTSQFSASSSPVLKTARTLFSPASSPTIPMYYQHDGDDNYVDGHIRWLRANSPGVCQAMRPGASVDLLFPIEVQRSLGRQNLRHMIAVISAQNLERTAHEAWVDLAKEKQRSKDLQQRLILVGKELSAIKEATSDQEKCTHLADALRGSCLDTSVRPQTSTPVDSKYVLLGSPPNAVAMHSLTSLTTSSASCGSRIASKTPPTTASARSAPPFPIPAINGAFDNAHIYEERVGYGHAETQGPYFEYDRPTRRYPNGGAHYHRRSLSTSPIRKQIPPMPEKVGRMRAQDIQKEARSKDAYILCESSDEKDEKTVRLNIPFLGLRGKEVKLRTEVADNDLDRHIEDMNSDLGTATSTRTSHRKLSEETATSIPLFRTTPPQTPIPRVPTDTNTISRTISNQNSVRITDSAPKSSKSPAEKSGTSENIAPTTNTAVKLSSTGTVQPAVPRSTIPTAALTDMPSSEMSTPSTSDRPVAPPNTQEKRSPSPAVAGPKPADQTVTFAPSDSISRSTEASPWSANDVPSCSKYTKTPQSNKSAPLPYSDRCSFGGSPRRRGAYESRGRGGYRGRAGHSSGLTRIGFATSATEAERKQEWLQWKHELMARGRWKNERVWDGEDAWKNG